MLILNNAKITIEIFDKYAIFSFRKIFLRKLSWQNNFYTVKKLKRKYKFRI